MNRNDAMRRLQVKLNKKEQEAQKAKKNGMHATYGNLMQEIQLLKMEYRRATMGSR